MSNQKVRKVQKKSNSRMDRRNLLNVRGKRDEEKGHIINSGRSFIKCIKRISKTKTEKIGFYIRSTPVL